VTRAHGFAEALLKLSHSPENRGRMEKLKGGLGEYAKGAQQIAAIRTEIVGIEAKRIAGGEPPAEAVAKITELNEEAVRVARDVTLPIANEVEELANKIVEFAKSSAEQANATAAKEMASTELLSLTIGVSAALLLIASCVFSIFTIARPIRTLSLAMEKLAEGDFGVVLPGLGRRDEVGLVAGAVEKFKVVSAQKAEAEAEAKIKQDQVAAQQRKADMIKLADGFEGAVGESSKPCLRPQPNSRPLPARSPPPPRERRNSPPWSRPPRRKPRLMSSLWRPPPRN
jgi:HAMP domain-containing protein